MVTGILQVNRNGKYTPESMKTLLETSGVAVLKGLVAIYNKQTADEQQTEETRHLNGVGFNGRDAEFGTSLAKRVISWNAQHLTQPCRQWSPMVFTTKQMMYARKMMMRYAGQLCKIAAVRG